MGEIGQPRKEVLYELKLWEIILIIRGYRRRYKTYCEMTRWKTWVIAGTQVKLSDSGIHCPEDMLPLPWDEKDENGFSGTTVTKEEEERLRAMMREENEKSGVTD